MVLVLFFLFSWVLVGFCFCRLVDSQGSTDTSGSMWCLDMKHFLCFLRHGFCPWASRVLERAGLSLMVWHTALYWAGEVLSPAQCSARSCSRVNRWLLCLSRGVACALWNSVLNLNEQSSGTQGSGGQKDTTVKVPVQVLSSAPHSRLL